MLTLRQGLSPARLTLDLAIDSVMALPIGAAYTAGDSRLRLSAKRSPCGVIIEAEADSMRPELTVVERSNARQMNGLTKDTADAHKETQQDVPWRLLIIGAAATVLLILVISTIKSIIK